MIEHCANGKMASHSLSINRSSLLKNASSLTICLMMMMILVIETVRCINFLPPTFSAAPRFSNSKLYNVTNYLNLENVQARAACLADVNDDTYTDMIVIGCDNKCVKVLLWSHSDWTYKEYAAAQINVPSNADNYTLIDDVAAADLNFDGMIDLLVTVTVYNTKTGQNFDGNQLLMYMGTSGVKFELFPEKLTSVDQVLLMETYGNMRVDLFGESLLNGKKRTYWINNGQNPLYNETEQIADDGLPLYPLAYPATNVFIDIDGDCSSDLFVVSCSDDGYIQKSNEICQNQMFEIWLNRNGKLMREGRLISAPKGSGRVLLTDFDRDGDNDLIVPVCDPQPLCETANKLIVYFNDQPSRKMTSLCTGMNFTLNRTQEISFPVNKRLAQTPQQGANYFPATIRTGDFNLDGYTDLILPVLETKNVIDIYGAQRVNTLKMMLWRNSPCPSGSSDSCYSRTLVEQVEGTEDLPSIDIPDTNYIPIYNGFFKDLDESGILDVMTTLVDPLSGNQSIQAYYNNYFNDAYFLKTLSLNGARKKGFQMPGMTFKFSVSDLQGVKHPRTSTQLTQSTYSALQTPYHLYGLGRTNGYIEDFFFGKPRSSSSQNYNYQTGIIPNSQLVAIPYPADAPTMWILELYVNPSTHTLWVAIAVFSTLVLIGLPIIILWRYEKWVDSKSKTKSQTANVASSTGGVLIG